MRSPDTHDILSGIIERKLIAVLRLSDASRGDEIIEAMAEGGITTIEITLTTPGALELIARSAGRGHLLVGAGTVLSADEAERVFDAGAAFYASPVFDRELVELAHARGKVAMPGAYTPTEIVAAARGGADLVKIFPMPSDAVAYLRALRGPLPHLRLAPSGGVTVTTAGALLAAGAAALNVGSWLTHDPAGDLLALEEIGRRAEQLVTAAARS